MTTEVTQDEAVVEKRNSAIKAIHDANYALDGLVVGTPEFIKVSEELEAGVLDLARLHRNWNEVTGEPDGMYDYGYEEDAPEGAKVPSVIREKLTTIEELSEEILYTVRSLNLKAPTFGSIGTFGPILSNHVSDLSTYHPKYSDRNGRIEA